MGRVYVVLAIACVSGYYSIASVFSALSLAGTYASFFLRSLIVVFSLFLIFSSVGRSAGRKGLALNCYRSVVLFWILYFFRVLSDTVVFPVVLSKDAFVYWMWAFGACAVPFLGLSSKPFGGREVRVVFLAVYFLSLVSCVLALLGGSALVEGGDGSEAYDSGRLRLDGLDPISLGHLGVLLAVQSVWVLLNDVFLLGTLWRTRAIAILAIGVGGYLMIAANSRGPLVAFFVCSAIGVFYAKATYRGYGLIALLLCVLSFVPFLAYLESEYGIATYSRLFGQALVGEDNTVYRLNAYSGAIDDFLNNPIFGSGIEEKSTGFYPHNLIVESFMATGMLGGVAFLFSSLGCIFLALRVMAAGVGLGWIGLLYIQYFIGAQFSGAIFGSAVFWAALALQIAVVSSFDRFGRVKS